SGVKKIEAAEASVPPPDPGASTTGLWAALDRLMAQPREERWAFWMKQAQKCIRCYACRGACPLCNCHECLMDKNVPQWFPTAADGPGNFAWHDGDSATLAGRCIGCGSCQEACPAGIPLGLLDAAMMRSVWKHFGYRSGMDPAAAPLQSDFRTDDRAEFIL
ncbi:MAG: 4Fe-4S dicluster domain-containing protein, partial [Planctomycetes bacterium]|nr:4Fe-4S dicluster domain-containing protein [Planctomycetota bacterium]